MTYYQTTYQQSAGPNLNVGSLLNGQHFDWRHRVAALHKRYPSAALAGCGATLVFAILLALPAETRLFLFCLGLMVVGIAGLIGHAVARWNRFCEQVAQQSYTMPWKRFYEA
jgi:hypothetical protein